MIILINTSGPICEFDLIDADSSHEYKWQADRKLASDLLGYLRDKLAIHSKTWSDITAIGVFEGPGSFTGLRIGITVMNTIADTQKIAIVGGRGNDWREEVVAKLKSGHNEKIILPFYGSEAHITVSKK